VTDVEILLLKTGEWYTLKMDGEPIGDFQYVDDEHNGLCFLQPAVNETGEYVNRVAWPDTEGLEAVRKENEGDGK
jgi:hypothetical protein